MLLLSVGCCIHLLPGGAILTMAETGSEKDDKTLFTDVCSRFLNMDPILVRSTRLAKASQSFGRTRMLLATLSTESQADDIVRSAKLLRDADDLSVRTTVFINRDITKKESNAAFKNVKHVERSRGCPLRLHPSSP